MNSHNFTIWHIAYFLISIKNHISQNNQTLYKWLAFHKSEGRIPPDRCALAEHLPPKKLLNILNSLFGFVQKLIQ